MSLQDDRTPEQHHDNPRGRIAEKVERIKSGFLFPYLNKPGCFFENWM